MNYNDQNIVQIKKTLEDSTKQKIVQHLKNNSPTNLGNIIKNLALNPRIGTTHIIELRHSGLIKKVKNTSLLELDKELMEIIEA